MAKNSRKNLLVFASFGLTVAVVAVATYMALLPKAALKSQPGQPGSFAKLEFFGGSRGPAGAHKQGPRESAVLYKLKENASPEAKAKFEEVFARYGMKLTKKLIGEKIHMAHAEASIDNEEELAKTLSETGAVEFAEADSAVELSFYPNDPNVGTQWHLSRINSFGAWDVTQGVSTVTVASCDTGVESTHPDLKANLILPGYNSEDGTTNSEPITSHGTMTAGTMAAISNNGLGVAGVAPMVRILPIRVSNLADGSAYFSAMASCIEYAADHGAKVVNLSYAGANSYTIDSAAQYLRSKGGILVMAAGNASADISADPDFTSFIIVGATDQNDARPYWSNYGTPIDIVAPGVDILTTTTGQTYAYGSGTSFSAPVVSGVAALLYSLKATFTPNEIENFLFQTTVPLGSGRNDPVFGNGRVDAQAAVAKAKASLTTTTPTPTPAPTATPKPSPTPKPGKRK